MPQRTRLRHGIPQWVDRQSHWFITTCCKERSVNSLANTAVHGAICEALRFYEKQGRLKVICMVTMPDHLHFVARFDHDAGMKKTVESLKRFLARKHGIAWQDGFFDHRIRSDKLLRETMDYVRTNPVRAGLVKSAEEWCYKWP